jgi:3-deoxy-D-manno-octulosonic-acid transferase
MVLFYNIGICLYATAVKITALFNPKATLWVKGRKNIFHDIKNALTGNEDIAWFHVSSLGEFEQGRPVMESFRLKYPNYKIFLTFFSPSGYEIRKNYEGADYIFYLPVDTKKNATQFLNLVKPNIAFFVKYEFWFHYLNQLNKRKIPTYIFSAIFRENQLFFKSYGTWYKKMLGFFTKIYVQNEESKQLLKTIHITNVEVGGDTRFDRVYALAKNAKPIELIEHFAKNNPVIIAGSTWEKDEELLAQYAQQTEFEVKWIIAPHEIHKSHIDKIISMFKQPVLKFSEANYNNINTTNILLIDSMGILSSVYRYGTLAYIGGGFGNGIHNTLEAATYGLPVVFGPNYKRFKEACDLLDLSSGFSITNFVELKSIFHTLLINENLTMKSGQSASNYVNQMRGGTDILLSQIML